MGDSLAWAFDMGDSRARRAAAQAAHEDVIELQAHAEVPPGWNAPGIICVTGSNVVAACITALWLQSLWEHAPMLLSCVWFVSSASALWSQWACIVKGPGYATSIPDLSEPLCEQEPLCEAQLQWCDKCNWVKPSRARHCSTCKRCVLRFDHHCYWVGGCVGLQNYGWFLRLTLYSGLGALAVALGAGFHGVMLWKPWELFVWADSGWGSQYLDPCVLLHILLQTAIAPHTRWLLLSAVFWRIAYIYSRCICLHVHLISVGQTTIEHITSGAGFRARHSNPSPWPHALHMHPDQRPDVQLSSRPDSALKPVGAFESSLHCYGPIYNLAD